jgi:hypothetical protein
MSATADASTTAAPASGRRAAPPWELILLGLAVLSLGLIPVEIHSAFGLPAHPLIIHVPVILVPLVGLAALALIARPSWIDRWGVVTGVFAVGAMASTFLAVGAGEAFREDRGGGPPGEAAKLDAHAQSGETLRILVALFTFALLGALWANRRGVLAGLPAIVARLVIAGLAIASIFFVIRTGHLGAQLTWGDSGGGRPAGFLRGGNGGGNSSGVPQGFAPPGG